MANPDSVPAGKYGKAALEKLGVWSGIEKQVARAENVRAALALVSRGEAPFGIVYSHRRIGRQGRQGCRYVSAGQLSAHRLSCRRRCNQQVRGGQGVAGLPALSCCAPGMGALRLRIGAIGHARSQPGRGRDPRTESACRGSQCHLQSAAGDPRRVWPGPFFFPGKTLVDAIVHLPLVLPPVVVGFALLVLFGKRGPIGSALDEWFGIVIAFRWTGAALASALMGFPLMVRAIRLSLEAIDQRLEVAARTLGGSRSWVFASVTLPLALPGIITGTLLSFARGLGEFGATITFVSNIPGETQTLPLAIYSFTQVPGGDAQALRLSIIAVVLSIIALATSEWLTRRSERMQGNDRR